MNSSFSQGLRSTMKRLKYLIVLLMSLWISLTVPGCGLFQANVPTTSSLQPTETISQAPASSQRFDGTTINVITRDETISKAITRHIAQFEALTGAKINLTALPISDLYSTLQQDWSSNAPKYSLAVVLPQWQSDFIKAGNLEDLTTRVKTDTALQWQDIAPFYRNVSATYEERTYGIPLDGDFHMVYYRTDLLKQAELTPPATWEEYLAIAKQFHGKDLNGDGEPDYGSCIENRDKSYSAFMLGSFATPFLQSQGTAQGAFFDVDTMKPLVNNPAFGRALDLFKQVLNYGVPRNQQLTVAQVRHLFTTGRCALSLDWGDTGTLAIDEKISKVNNKVGAVVTPGTKEVLDRKTGKLVACDKFTCPYAIDGVNHAPYAANIGWIGVVFAKAPPHVKDAAYAFLSYVSQPAQSNVDVTIGATGFNPYRISQFKDAAPWVQAGMSPEAASNYLGAIGVSLNNPNMVLDLKIPQNEPYQFKFLNGVLSDFLTDKITTTEAMQQIEQKWEQLTDTVGRASQKAAYRSSLGLPA